MSTKEQERAPDLERFRPMALPLRGRADAAVMCSVAAVPETAYSRIMTGSETWLDAAASKRAAALISEKRRREYLLGRYVCKRAAGHVLGEDDLTRLAIETGVSGQPRLSYPASRHPELSIAHCEGGALAIAAASGCPAGVDIEPVIAEHRLSSLRDHVTEADFAALADIGELQTVLATRIWTIKEAASKIIGGGLWMPFTLLAFSHRPGTAGDHLICRFHNFPHLQCHSWLTDGYALAVALPWAVEMEASAPGRLKRYVEDAFAGG